MSVSTSYVTLSPESTPTRSQKCAQWCNRSYTVLTLMTACAMVATGIYMAVDCSRADTCSTSRIFTCAVLIGGPPMPLVIARLCGCQRSLFGADAFKLIDEGAN
jgi:hypothetical protein